MDRTKAARRRLVQQTLKVNGGSYKPVAEYFVGDRPVVAPDNRLAAVHFAGIHAAAVRFAGNLAAVVRFADNQS